MDHLVGKRLDGRYELREIIGVGGMAVVYKAYDSIDDRIVAVKILKEEFVRNDEFRRRFKNESKAIAVLSHPNIVKVYDVSFGDNLQYIVMEFINGIPLKRFIERRGVLSYNDAVHFTVQILRALQHAHEKGIVHRDIKPQNIMLLQDGTIKVADFGIARFSTSQQRTMTDQAIGSVHYISPEQARGDFTDGKADIYSVGVMLYEMLTGRVPFEADSPVSVAIMQLQSDPQSPRSLNPLIPLGLEQITLRAMQKNPQMRYRSAAEMLLDVEDFQRNPEMTFTYDYFVDDSPTKYVTGAKTNTGSLMREDISPPEEEPEEEEAAQKAPIIPILAGVAAAFVLITGVIFFLVWKFVINPDGVPELSMPNLVGQDINDVKKSEKYAEYKFNLEVVSYDPSDEYPAEVIIKQETKENTKIKPGQKIRVWVSQGPQLVDIPEIKNYDKDSAESALKTLGFKTRIVQKKDDTIPVGHVIGTEPGIGSRLKLGSEVIIFISLGPDSVPADVPNVVYLPLEEAKKQLRLEGLDWEVIPEASDKAKDIVLRQSPERGTLEKGDKVKLYVSTGIPPEEKYQANIHIELPTEYSQYVTVYAILNNSVVYSSASSVRLGDQKAIDITFETTQKTGKVRIAFTPSDSSTNTKYPWIEFDYDFKNEYIIGDTTEYTLDSRIFPKKDEHSSSSTSSSNSSSQTIAGYR